MSARGLQRCLERVMLFSWLRKRRRRNLLAEPFPSDWLKTLHGGVGHYSLIPENQRAKLGDIVRIMLAEKEWEGCRGLELTDEMRVVVAASAGVLVLGFDDFYFDNVQTILVYPDAFVARQERSLGGQATMEEEVDLLGTAHYRGPVTLAWNDVEDHALNPGAGWNLVFHEFAHQLDMLNGEADGVPMLTDAPLANRWQSIMNREFQRLRRIDRRGRNAVLDPYGAQDPAEFFAVATECFFDSPRAMQSSYPELYQLFRDYFRQDPAAWPPFEAAP
jgi:Mlc titration factor MtfA (ptsG expression regulator)